MRLAPDLARIVQVRHMAQTSAAKADALSDLGTDRVVTCGEDLAGVLGTESVDLVVDNVA